MGLTISVTSKVGTERVRWMSCAVDHIETTARVAKVSGDDPFPFNIYRNGELSLTVYDQKGVDYLAILEGPSYQEIKAMERTEPDSWDFSRI